MKPTRSSKLLIDEPALQVLPSLAVAIGLNEAIFLQQLHFRLRLATVMVDDQLWLHKSAEQWAEEMPFWSVPTIRRIITALKEKGLILTRGDLNSMKMDKTLWFAIDYDRLSEVDPVITPSNDFVTPSDQLDHTRLSSRSLGHTGTSDQVDHTNNIRSKRKKQEEGEEPASLTAQFTKAYEHHWALPITSAFAENMKDWADRVPLEAWEYALKEAAQKGKIGRWDYLESILRRVEREGIGPKEPTANGHAGEGRAGRKITKTIGGINYYDDGTVGGTISEEDLENFLS